MLHLCVTYELTVVRVFGESYFCMGGRLCVEWIDLRKVIGHA